MVKKNKKKIVKEFFIEDYDSTARVDEDDLFVELENFSLSEDDYHDIMELGVGDRGFFGVNDIYVRRIR